MTITFVPTANIKEVEVKGYGVVKIRPYGAGEELQISKNFRELDGLQKEAKSFLAEVREKHDDDESKLDDDEKKKFETIREGITKLSDELNDLIKGTISSDDPKVAERLFNELPMTEIRKLITMALGKEADAKA